MKGTIASKNEEKKFGFITPEGMEGSRESNVFFHFTALEGISFEELVVGDVVEFDKEASEKGDRAVRVMRATV